LSGKLFAMREESHNSATKSTAKDDYSRDFCKDETETDIPTEKLRMKAD